MNLYLIEQRDGAPVEYDVVTAIVGAATDRAEARRVLLDEVFNGSQITFIGKAKPGTKSGEVILKQTLDG